MKHSVYILAIALATVAWRHRVNAIAVE